MKLRLSSVLALGLLSTACGSDSAEPPQSSTPAPVAGSAGSQPSAAGTLAAGRGATGTPQAGSAPAAGRGAAGVPSGVAGTGAAGNTAAGRGAAGMNAAGMSAVAGMSSPAGAGGAAGAPPVGTVEPGKPPVCEVMAPAEFEPNPSVGGGGSPFKDSPHFRIVGASDAQADGAIKSLEAAYNCFVETLCWRSSGLSYKATNDNGPFSKMNIYVVGSLGSAAGQMFSDAGAGLSYLKVVGSYVTDPKVIVHEYGHALTYHEKGWVDQTRTGAWWETVANFVADTYMTSPLCAASRAKFGLAEGKTIIELNKVLGDSFQVMVDGSQGSGNYYQAWPFLTYLTNNPDGYAGLGATALRDMFRKHMRNNETPFHVLERVAMGTKVQQIVGRYWARMAYVDIGHKQAQAAFMSGRSRINFANLDASGSGMYKVKAARQPRYMGANIIPLTGSGMVTVQVTASGGGFTATLAIRASSGTVRYVDLPNGSGSAMVESGEEASLVVANTPAALIQYDPFMISGDVARGLDYTVQITGAMPAN